MVGSITARRPLTEHIDLLLQAEHPGQVRVGSTGRPTRGLLSISSDGPGGKMTRSEPDPNRSALHVLHRACAGSRAVTSVPSDQLATNVRRGALRGSYANVLVTLPPWRILRQRYGSKKLSARCCWNSVVCASPSCSDARRHSFIAPPRRSPPDSTRTW